MVVSKIFYFHPYLRFPIGLIFFRWVETTNQINNGPSINTSCHTPSIVSFAPAFVEMAFGISSWWKWVRIIKCHGIKLYLFLILRLVYIRSTPHPVTVTTRIITFLVGNPYKPSFATVTGWGVDPMYIYIDLLVISPMSCFPEVLAHFVWMKTMRKNT